jgi:hypothetical protein
MRKLIDLDESTFKTLSKLSIDNNTNHFKGFDFVGFEIDKTMCEQSDKRFHNEISQQRLF